MRVCRCLNLPDERTSCERDLEFFFYFWGAWNAPNCVSSRNRRIEDDEFPGVFPMIMLTGLRIFPLSRDFRAMLVSSSGV